MHSKKLRRFKRDEMPSSGVNDSNELQALAEKSDNEIDVSDIPEAMVRRGTRQVSQKIIIFPISGWRTPYTYLYPHTQLF